MSSQAIQAACMCAAFACVSLTYQSSATRSAIRTRFVSRANVTRGQLRMLELPSSTPVLVVGAATLLLLPLLALTIMGIWPAALALLLWTAPAYLLEAALRRRRCRLESQLTGWILSLANCLKASTSLAEAMGSTSSLTARPLRAEVERVLQEHALGAPLDHALERMAMRNASPLLDGTLGTIRIARRTGGDLASTLETTASTMREMARLEGVVRTRTAEGRAQATLVCILPAPLFVTLNWLDPGFLRPLINEPVGHTVLAAAACLWAGAVLLARRIVRVSV